jgi:hypothetical protein
VDADMGRVAGVQRRVCAFMFIGCVEDIVKKRPGRIGWTVGVLESGCPVSLSTLLYC